MKKLVCLLLAVVMTIGCLGGVCFADDPIAVVINGEEETKVYNTDEIKMLISYDGTTVVKMLRDFIQEESTFIYRVPTFTLDLNGFTAGTKGGTAIGVHYEGSLNSTTVVKNGVLVAGTGSGVAMNIQVGGMRAENVVFTCDSGNTVLGVYQLSDQWNDDNLITGCTIVGNDSSAIAFNSTTDSQSHVSIKVENTTLINAKTGKGTYAINQRQVPGGTVVFGKSVNVYSTEKDGLMHPGLKAAGETVSYVGEQKKVSVEKLGLDINNLYHWATPEGDFSNWKSDFVLPTVQNTVEIDPLKTLEVTPFKTFGDVKKSFWAYDAVTTAAASGILDGMTAEGAENFNADAAITETEFRRVMSVFFADESILAADAGATALSREAMAQILYAAASGYKAYEGTEKAKSVPDIASVTEGIQEDVLWLYGAGLLVGMDKKGTFAPANALTRAQTAQILARLLHKERNFVEFILPTIHVEETLANRQKAYVTMARSYYNKNPYVQYDWIGLSKAGLPYGRRYHEDITRNAPEYASPDNTEYFVCAAWATVLGEHVFNYRILGGPDDSVTKYLSAITPAKAGDIFVYQYKNTGDEAADRASVEKVKSLLQNGDVVTWTLKSGYGHTGIYIDDVTGDGKPDFIHCSDNGGGRYSLETGIDKFEQNGGIFINRTTGAACAAEMLFDDASSTALVGTVRYSIVRPAALDPKQYPIQEQAKTRMAYDGLTVYYTADCGFYGAVEKGTEVTYKLTIQNKSEQDYRGLKVQIPNYENAYITKLDGKAYNEPTVSMYLDIPAGESVTHTVSMMAYGEVGSEINSCGYVHGVKLPVMHTPITSHTPKAEDFKKDSAVQAAVAAENNMEAFANAYYKAATGKEANIPTAEEILDAGFKKARMGAFYMYSPKKEADTALYDMLVIDYYGGQNVAEKNGVSHRVVNTRLQDALPGDVMLVIPNEKDMSTAEMWVFDGELFRTPEDGKLVTRGYLDVMKLHSRDLFVLIRPAQMP